MALVDGSGRRRRARCGHDGEDDDGFDKVAHRSQRYEHA
jgi:hypothetical protein